MSIGFWQIAIVVVLVVLLFGRGKISSLMGDVAKGIKSFKKGMSDNPDQTSSLSSTSEKTSNEESSTSEKTSNEDQVTMPQIGWFEILIIVVLSILIIGPKDFPIVLKKIGSWMGSLKSYFSEIKKDMTDMENAVEDEISIKENHSNQTKDKQKDE